jgi:hypothetical protein
VDNRNRANAEPGKVVEYRQLCAIATAVLREDPTIDGAEWKERIKCRLVALGFAYPTNDRLTAALDATERAHPRPELHSTPQPTETTDDRARPLTRAESATVTQKLDERFPGRVVPRSMPRVPMISAADDAKRRALVPVVQAWHDLAKEHQELERTVPKTADRELNQTLDQIAQWRRENEQCPSANAGKTLNGASPTTSADDVDR